MLNAVVTTVTMRQGKNMSAGLVLPAAALNPITVLGMSSNPLALSKKRVAIARDIFSFFAFGMSSIAATAVGVLAFATPIRFADTLTNKYWFARGLNSPKSFVIIGFKSVSAAESAPASFMISIKPPQTQYAPSNVTHNSKLSDTPEVITVSSPSGFFRAVATMPDSIIINHKTDKSKTLRTKIFYDGLSCGITFDFFKNGNTLGMKRFLPLFLTWLFVLAVFAASPRPLYAFADGKAEVFYDYKVDTYLKTQPNGSGCVVFCDACDVKKLPADYYAVTITVKKLPPLPLRVRFEEKSAEYSTRFCFCPCLKKGITISGFSVNLQIAQVGDDIKIGWPVIAGSF